MKLACYVLVVVMLAWVCRERVYHLWVTEAVTNTVGPVQREWNVVSTYDNSEHAANKLSRMNSVMIEFLRVLGDKYHIDESDDEIAMCHDHKSPADLPNDTYNYVAHLLRNYNPDEFYENDPQYSRDTSYTIAKGGRTHICLRNRHAPETLVPDDILLFVMLHEASHMANYNDIGHSTQFWEVFKFILHEAELAGIYKRVDYAAHPVDYCGLIISYQPLDDNTLRDLWVFR